MVFNDQNNQGILGNFQNAFNHSVGEIVFFCDQDDVWFPNKIERITKVFNMCNEQVIIHNAQVMKECDDGSFELIGKHLMGENPFDSSGLYKINGLALVWPSFYFCVIQGMCMCVKRDYLLSISPFSKGSNHDNWILFCATADDTLLAVKDDLTYYRVHENNACGLQEYKNKEPLWERLKSFDHQGKESILKQYLWYMDASSYLGNRDILDDRVKRLISFFTDKRISAISKDKINAIIDLVKAYRDGAYEIDRIIVFLHDVAYVLMHTRKTRRKYIESFQKELRPQSHEFVK